MPILYGGKYERRYKGYRLLKFSDLAAAQKDGAKGDMVGMFVANGPRAAYRETILIDEARAYRCLLAP